VSAAPPVVRAGPVNVPLDYTIPVNVQIMPMVVSATFADPGNAGPYVPALVIVTPDGNQLGPFPLGTAIAAGASARVSWFPGGELDQAAAGVSPSGVIVETFYVSSVDSTPHVSSTVLQSGRTYLITVQGTFSERNVALPLGNPQPDAMFPTSTAGRVSTQVGWDAECIFAEQAGGTLGHDTAFRMDLGDGLGMRHIEPVGGPFGTPQANYFYTWQIVGHGAALQAQVFDSVYTDNYGKLLVTIQTVGGGSSGGGGGSLLPDPTLQPTGQVLQTLSGTATWSGIDGGSP
jgi:hypothetical protein